MMSQRTSEFLSEDGHGHPLHPLQIPSLCGSDHDVRNDDDQGGSTSGSGPGRSSSTTATPSGLSGSGNDTPNWDDGYVLFLCCCCCYFLFFKNCSKALWTEETQF